MATPSSRPSLRQVRFLPWLEIGEHLGTRPLLLGKRPPHGYNGDDKMRFAPQIRRSENGSLVWRDSGGRYGISTDNGLQWIQTDSSAQPLDWAYREMDGAILQLISLPKAHAEIVTYTNGSATRIPLPLNAANIRQLEFLDDKGALIALMDGLEWKVFQSTAGTEKYEPLPLPLLKDATGLKSKAGRIITWREIAGRLEWIRESELSANAAYNTWKLPSEPANYRLIAFKGPHTGYFLTGNALLEMDADGKSNALAVPYSILRDESGQNWMTFWDEHQWKVTSIADEVQSSKIIPRERTQPLLTAAQGWQLAWASSSRWTFRGNSKELQRNIFWDYDPVQEQFAASYYTLADQSHLWSTGTPINWIFDGNGKAYIPIAGPDGLHVVEVEL